MTRGERQRGLEVKIKARREASQLPTPRGRSARPTCPPALTREQVGAGAQRPDSAHPQAPGPWRAGRDGHRGGAQAAGRRPHAPHRSQRHVRPSAEGRGAPLRHSAVGVEAGRGRGRGRPWTGASGCARAQGRAPGGAGLIRQRARGRDSDWATRRRGVGKRNGFKPGRDSGRGAGTSAEGVTGAGCAADGMGGASRGGVGLRLRASL